MSNHFTGLSLGPPLGDQRLDLCDLYAFQAPADPTRTVLILNANPNADALHPDAIYRLAVDNDGDLLNDIAFSFVFSVPENGRQTVDVFKAVGDDAESALPVGEKIFDAVIDQVEVKRVRDLTPRDIEHDNPEFRRHEEMIHFLEQIYGKKVTMEDTVTVVRFSQIIVHPPSFTDARLGIGGAQN